MGRNKALNACLNTAATSNVSAQCIPPDPAENANVARLPVVCPNACMAKLILVPKVVTPKAKQISRKINAISKVAFLQCACGSRDMIQVTTGLVLERDTPTMGTKQWLCSAYLVQGVRSIIY